MGRARRSGLCVRGIGGQGVVEQIGRGKRVLCRGGGCVGGSWARTSEVELYVDFSQDEAKARLESQQAGFVDHRKSKNSVNIHVEDFNIIALLTC